MTHGAETPDEPRPSNPQRLPKSSPTRGEKDATIPHAHPLCIPQSTEVMNRTG
jgi:hypothetical protein